MRKMIILSLALVFTTVAFAQPAAPKNQLTERDYMLKSKQQKTAAWVLVGGGFALSSTGLLIVVAEGINDLGNGFYDIVTGEETVRKTSYTGDILLIAGLVSMTGSIPFFISASRNKRKAAKVSLSMKIESRPILQQAAVAKIKYPALAVKFNL